MDDSVQCWSNFRVTSKSGPSGCKSGKRRKTGAKCAVHKGENCLLSDPTWAQDVCVQREMSLSCLLYQAVMWPLCKYITRVQQARLLASRGCVRSARRPLMHSENFKESTHAHMCRSFDSSNPSYSYPEIATVIRPNCSICQVNSSRSPQYPCQALISICGISSPSAFVPMSLGFTSVLTDDIVKSFRHTKSWMNKNLVWMCFILRLTPCFVATARAVLLSALACIRIDCPISFRKACAKINSADSAPRAYIWFSTG